LIIRTTLLVGVVEDAEIAVINAFAGNDISKELYEGGLSDTSLSNKKDGVWCNQLVL